MAMSRAATEEYGSAEVVGWVGSGQEEREELGGEGKDQGAEDGRRGKIYQQ